MQHKKGFKSQADKQKEETWTNLCGIQLNATQRPKLFPATLWLWFGHKEEKKIPSEVKEKQKGSEDCCERNIEKEKEREGGIYSWKFGTVERQMAKFTSRKENGAMVKHTKYPRFWFHD